MIKSKKDMYKLYEKGAFGNKLRTWPSVDDFYESKEKLSHVVLRYSGAGGGGFAAYDVPVEEIEDRIKEAKIDRSLVKVSEGAPDDFLTIQGEFAILPTGIYVLKWSDYKGKMRDAMKQAKHDLGLVAKIRLETYLSPASYDDVMDLLSLHEDAIVEFSAYSYNLGSCVGRNTIIWEVRNY